MKRMKDRPDILRLTLIGVCASVAIGLAVYISPSVASQDRMTVLEPLISQIDEAPSLNPSSTPALRFGKSDWFQDESAPAFIWVVRTEPRYIGELLPVQFSTVDGTAVGGASCGPGIDYIRQENVSLVMQYQYQQINVYIQLCPDGTPEPPETVTLVLSSQHKTTPATAQLTISDEPLRFSISGRALTADGRPIRNVRMHISDGRQTLTSSFGWYYFDGVSPGEPYQIAVVSSRFTFTPGGTWVFTIGDIENLNFIADPQ